MRGCRGLDPYYDIGLPTVLKPWRQKYFFFQWSRYGKIRGYFLVF